MGGFGSQRGRAWSIDVDEWKCESVVPTIVPTYENLDPRMRAVSIIRRDGLRPAARFDAALPFHIAMVATGEACRQDIVGVPVCRWACGRPANCLVSWVVPQSPQLPDVPHMPCSSLRQERVTGWLLGRAMGVEWLGTSNLPVRIQAKRWSVRQGEGLVSVVATAKGNAMHCCDASYARCRSPEGMDDETWACVTNRST